MNTQYYKFIGTIRNIVLIFLVNTILISPGNAFHQDY
jgi:hypothetical protein